MGKAIIGWGLSPFLPFEADPAPLLEAALKKALALSRIYPEEVDRVLLPGPFPLPLNFRCEMGFYRDNSLRALEQVLEAEEVLILIALPDDGQPPSTSCPPHLAAWAGELMKRNALSNPYSLLGERKHFSRIKAEELAPAKVQGAAVLVVAEESIAPALNPGFIRVKKWQGESFDFLETDDFHGCALVKALEEMGFELERAIEGELPFVLNPSGGTVGWGWLGRSYGIERVAYLAGIMASGQRALVRADYPSLAEIYLEKS